MFLCVCVCVCEWATSDNWESSVWLPTQAYSQQCVKTVSFPLTYMSMKFHTDSLPDNWSLSSQYWQYSYTSTADYSLRISSLHCMIYCPISGLVVSALHDLLPNLRFGSVCTAWFTYCPISGLVVVSALHDLLSNLRISGSVCTAWFIVQSQD